MVAYSRMYSNVLSNVFGLLRSSWISWPLGHLLHGAYDDLSTAGLNDGNGKDGDGNEGNAYWCKNDKWMRILLHVNYNL